MSQPPGSSGSDASSEPEAGDLGYPGGYGPPAQGYGYTHPPAVSTNAKATAAMVTGITTLVLSWCCGFGLVGLVAVVLGARARTEIRHSGGRQNGDGLALAGIITGAVATVVGAGVLVAIGVALTRTGGGGFLYP